MKKIFIDPGNINQALVKEAAALLAQGQIVALPTETVYGLAVRVGKADSLANLFALKARSKDKPFSLALGTVDEAFRNYFSTFPPFAYRLVEKFWPGPLTIIYYQKDDEKVGIRVPAHAVISHILQELGMAVYLPSANLSGEKEAVTAQEVENAFAGKINLIVDGGPCTFSKSSTVLDLTEKPFKILRQGVINEAEIAKVFFKKRIVFVCTGNSCRSPMAHFLFNKYLKESKLYFDDRYEIISRGISAFEGTHAAEPVIDILRDKEGLDIRDFIAQRLDRATILSSDLIFTMEDRQTEYILRAVPTAAGRVFNLKKFLPSELEHDIPDPIGKPTAAYESVYAIIKEAVLELTNWV